MRNPSSGCSKPKGGFPAVVSTITSCGTCGQAVRAAASAARHACLSLSTVRQIETDGSDESQLVSQARMQLTKLVHLQQLFVGRRERRRRRITTVIRTSHVVIEDTEVAARRIEVEEVT